MRRAKNILPTSQEQTEMEKKFPITKFHVSLPFEDNIELTKEEMECFFGVDFELLVDKWEKINPQDGKPKIKDETAIMKYLAFLLGYANLGEYLEKEKIELYKRGRSKVWMGDRKIIEPINKLKDFLRDKHFFYEEDVGMYNVKAARVLIEEKGWILVNDEYLYVPLCYCGDYCILPKEEKDVTFCLRKISAVSDVISNNTIQKQREIQKEINKLMNQKLKERSFRKKEREAIRTKYKKDRRVKKIFINSNGVINISLKGRKVIDQSAQVKNVVLPPMRITYDMLTGETRFPDEVKRHPHSLGYTTPCFGNFQTVLSEAKNELSLLKTIDALIEFCCSYTSTDSMGTVRDVRHIMKNYLSDVNFRFYPEDWVDDVTYREIFLTLRTKANLLWAASKVPELFRESVGYIDLLNWDANSDYYLIGDKGTHTGPCTWEEEEVKAVISKVYPATDPSTTGVEVTA